MAAAPQDHNTKSVAIVPLPPTHTKTDDNITKDDALHNHTLVKRLQKSCQKGDVQVVRGIIAGAEEAIGERPHSLPQYLKIQEILSHADKNDGWSALHFAAQGTTPQHTQIIKMLCKAGANVNLPDKMRKWTPLHLAAQFAEESGISELIEALADRQARDKFGQKPKDCANGPNRRKLLERPLDTLNTLLVRVKGVIQDYRERGNQFSKDQAVSKVGQVDSMRRIELINELRKELQEAVTNSKHDLELIDYRLNTLMDRPMEKEHYEDFTTGFQQCKNLIQLKKDLEQEKAELDEGEPEVHELQMIVATEYLLAALSEIDVKFRDLQIMTAGLPVGTVTAELKVKRAQTYRKCHEHIDLAIAKGKKGEESYSPEQGHWGNPEVLKTTQQLCLKFEKTEFLVEEKSKRQLEKDVLEMMVPYRPVPTDKEKREGEACTADSCSCQ